MRIRLTTWNPDGTSSSREFSRVKALGHDDSKPGILLIVMLADPADWTGRVEAHSTLTTVANKIHGTLAVKLENVAELEVLEFEPWPFTS